MVSRKSAYLSEFSDLIERLSIQPGKLLIVGDFNVHWDKQDWQEGKDLVTLLASFNLEQHVKEITHTFRHILDYVISGPDDDLLDDCDVDSLLSEHHAVHFTLKCQKPHPIHKAITFCKNQ